MSWEQLHSIVLANAEELSRATEEKPVICPECANSLDENSEGIQHCVICLWQSDYC